MGFSRSPKLLKGAFVQIDNLSSVQRAIVFQYNPEKIDRKIKGYDSPQFRWIHRNRNKTSSPEITPREFIAFNLILDATDELENPEDNINTVENGIYPNLSALEMLLYPKKYLSTNRSFMGITLPRSNKNQSLTLLVWGNKRILPIHITEIHIVEEMFDSSLNPIRANIEITMCVLNDIDLLNNKKGLEYWNTHLANKISFADKVYVNTNLVDSNHANTLG